MDRSTAGKLGEDLALGFLLACGFTCRDRRWRRGGGEIDLVVERADLLVFVEVKFRGPGSLGRASESVTAGQLRRLRRLVGRYCHEHGSGGRNLRLDVITVDHAGEGRGMVLRHFPGVA